MIGIITRMFPQYSITIPKLLGMPCENHGLMVRTSEDGLSSKFHLGMESRVAEGFFDQADPGDVLLALPCKHGV